jgi:4-hydroxy-3-polyprenylbenzoate decarboxylase
MPQTHTRRLVVGITGETGSISASGFCRLCGARKWRHTLLSANGATRAHETSYPPDQVQLLATRCYNANDQDAPLSRGSFLTNGMVVAPSRMRTHGAIARGQGERLVHRAADVILKEWRKLVLLVRGAPLNEIHLENMLTGVSVQPESKVSD